MKGGFRTSGIYGLKYWSSTIHFISVCFHLNNRHQSIPLLHNSFNQTSRDSHLVFQSLRTLCFSVCFLSCCCTRNTNKPFFMEHSSHDGIIVLAAFAHKASERQTPENKHTCNPFSQWWKPTHCAHHGWAVVTRKTDNVSQWDLQVRAQLL